jgi:hypothetical protein
MWSVKNMADYFWTYSQGKVKNMPRKNAAQASRVHREFFLNLPSYWHRENPPGFLWAHSQLTQQLTRRTNGIVYFLISPGCLLTDLIVNLFYNSFSIYPAGSGWANRDQTATELQHRTNESEVRVTPVALASTVVPIGSSCGRGRVEGFDVCLSSYQAEWRVYRIILSFYSFTEVHEVH